MLNNKDPYYQQQQHALPSQLPSYPNESLMINNNGVALIPEGKDDVMSIFTPNVATSSSSSVPPSSTLPTVANNPQNATIHDLSQLLTSDLSALLKGTENAGETTGIAVGGDCPLKKSLSIGSYFNAPATPLNNSLYLSTETNLNLQQQHQQQQDNLLQAFAQPGETQLDACALTENVLSQQQQQQQHHQLSILTNHNLITAKGIQRSNSLPINVTLFPPLKDTPPSQPPPAYHLGSVYEAVGNQQPMQLLQLNSNEQANGSGGFLGDELPMDTIEALEMSRENQGCLLTADSVAEMSPLVMTGKWDKTNKYVFNYLLASLLSFFAWFLDLRKKCLSAVSVAPQPTEIGIRSEIQTPIVTCVSDRSALITTHITSHATAAVSSNYIMNKNSSSFTPMDERSKSNSTVASMKKDSAKIQHYRSRGSVSLPASINQKGLSALLNGGGGNGITSTPTKANFNKVNQFNLLQIV